MVTSKDKMEFAYCMAKHSTVTLGECQRLLRLAATLQRLATEQCNREWTERDEKKRARVKIKVHEILARHICTARFSNDPRGCCLKVAVVDGYTNDWGKEGICVPA